MLLVWTLLCWLAVRCEELNESERPAGARGRGGVGRGGGPEFRVYWNVPTAECAKHGLFFTGLHERYGILQNSGDKFRGEHLTILYDPGVFPALLQNLSSDQLVYRNGGVPQQGDLERHRDMFRHAVETSIPDVMFNGVGVIDFESWRPIFRQNFGSLAPYKKVSYEVERSRHRFWPQSWIQEEAVRRFEEAGALFMQATLRLARKLRPLARWGYYAYPYCFNMSPSHMRQECADKVGEENDRTGWLWEESSTLLPSLYSSRELTSSQLQQLVRGRVTEAVRVRSGPTVDVLPYYWYRYRDGGFITQKDLSNTLASLYESAASGVIIWGSSKDVSSRDKCADLLQYVDDVLGPAVAKYTKNNLAAEDGPPVEEPATREQIPASSASLSCNSWKSLLSILLFFLLRQIWNN